MTIANNQEIFVKEYVKNHGVSIAYADAIWYTLTDEAKQNPIKSAAIKC